MSVSVAVRFLLFFSITGLISVLGHVYLYRRMFRDTSGHPGWRKAGIAAMASLCLLMLGSRLLSRVLPSDTVLALATVGWTWMGVTTYLLLAFFTLGGLRALSHLVHRWRARPSTASAAPAPAPPPVSEERRQFLARATAGGALLATSGFVGYGSWRAFHPPTVTEVAVRLPGLPKALDGFTLVQLSDIHVGPVIQRRFMNAMVDQCNALKPDLVCITGDLVDGSVDELGYSVAALANLRSRHGTFFVTGNHEYYSGDEEWTEALKGMSVDVLRNRHVRIGEPGASFDLVGVDDWAAARTGSPHRYDLSKALSGRDPERAAVLLAHQPSNWREAAKAGIGLQLSGHTHGGQFFPFTLAISAIWEHDAGLFQENGRHIYVSRGTGFWGPPVRVAAPPEIVKVTLLS
ncbi:metallophosphoesterase [Hyalangium rubrum]|uniref:Metallophosphoesterase n=1 Tax=Hyalangium rubrum TaxID=3103134 RepID=A0ABU5HFD2_9BACT|nr:metallophosphoesterase [Hyalangium sp. s54d21]MDY7232187.1 metallophosphoesterase [Hyalangium sp. s54d21]